MKAFWYLFLYVELKKDVLLCLADWHVPVFGLNQVLIRQIFYLYNLLRKNSARIVDELEIECSEEQDLEKWFNWAN